MLISRALLPICLSALLGACSLFIAEDDDSVLGVAEQLLEAQKDEYGDPRKIDLPIRIHYTINRKPLVDYKMEIEFEFIAEQPIELMRIGLTVDDGLELDSSEIKEQYRNMPARQVLKKSVVVVPTREDRFHVNMYIVTENGDDRRARLIRVPVAIGEAAQAPAKS